MAGNIKIQGFCDMKKFEEIMDNWAKSTGLAAVASDPDGRALCECGNTKQAKGLLVSEISRRILRSPSHWRTEQNWGA